MDCKYSPTSRAFALFHPVWTPDNMPIVKPSNRETRPGAEEPGLQLLNDFSKPQCAGPPPMLTPTGTMLRDTARAPSLIATVLTNVFRIRFA